MAPHSIRRTSASAHHARPSAWLAGAVVALATLVSACGSDSSVSVYIPVTRSPSAAVTPPATTTATTMPTRTNTGVPSPTATNPPATAVPSATATRQPTRTATATVARTATATVPPTATATASPPPSPPVATSTATVTPVPPSPTATASATAVPPTRTVTATATIAPSATFTATIPPTSTASSTATATVTATGVPTGTAAATATATATRTAVPPTNTPTATFTPTATPTVEEGAPCGDRVLQPGQTCAECPADCVVGPCTAPGAPTQAFVIELENEFGFDPTTATVVLAYNSTKLSIPGTGAVPSVRQRVVAPAPLPQAFTPNDMDYAVRVLISRNTPLATLFTATFDRCGGAPAPTLADVACTVEGCAQQGGAVPGCSCFARLP